MATIRGYNDPREGFSISDTTLCAYHLCAIALLPVADVVALLSFFGLLYQWICIAGMSGEFEFFALTLPIFYAAWRVAKSVI